MRLATFKLQLEHLGIPCLLALAFIIRLYFIFRTPGGYDLEIYTYFARIMHNSQNPYKAPIDGPISPLYADMLPFNLNIFSLALTFWNDPRALRISFAAAEIGLSMVVWYCFDRPRSYRFMMVLFLLFSPFVLYSFTITAEDKPILLLGLFLLVLFLERRKSWSAVVTCAFLAMFKWMGVFLILPVAYHYCKKVNYQFLFYFSVFGVLFVFSHFPFFPDSLITYHYRSLRAAFSPLHQSIMLPLTHIYNPLFIQLLIPLTILLHYFLYYSSKLNITETIVLLVFFSYILAPDNSYDRLTMIALPMFLITRLSTRFSLIAYIVLWLGSIVSYMYISSTGVLGAVFLSNFMPLTLLGFFLASKFRKIGGKGSAYNTGRFKE